MENFEKNEAEKSESNEREVPFFKQTTPLNCGPSVLRMAVAYFDKDLGIDVFEKATGTKEGKSLSTIQIAIAAASLGYGVDFYSTHPVFNPENEELDYYQKYSDSDRGSSEERLERAKENNVSVHEQSLELDELLGFLGDNSIPIVLLNWSIVKGEDAGYQGHFVPVVDYDENNVYIHNSGFLDGSANMPIKREVFDKARKSKGTDEDVVVVFKKK
ncbi:MAG: peptidase C39 family protein [Candidatus Spechtbacterales bacterium]